MLFESTLAVPFARQIKQKLRYPLDTGVLGGRGWITRAAHLKKPRRGFFTRRTIRRVDAVRIHPCVPFFKADKTETPVPIGYRSSWWARVDYASRAAKNSPLGCFCAVFCDSAAAVRIHPCIPFFKADKTETPVPIGYRSPWWARVDSNNQYIIFIGLPGRFSCVLAAL